MRSPTPLALILAALTLIGCTQFPELDGTVSPEVQNAPYPALLPLEPILVQAAPSPLDTEAVQSNLDSRIAGLRARADRLRGPILSGPERTRLGEEIERR
ncbi:MAG: hypothetical protein P1U53_13840 [Sulfitobacter sp.]|nr:hypothetical protein [Sulfitobacter sp.]